MILHDVLKAISAERPISQVTIAQYRRAINRLEEFLKRPATNKDLNTATINAYLVWLETQCSLSPVSVLNHRIGILTVWSYAVHPLDLCQPFLTRRIRRPKTIAKPVVAWSIDEVQCLLRAAQQITGTLKNGMQAHLILDAWIRLGTETGLRPSDLRELRWQSIDFQRKVIYLNQHKTGGALSVGFSDETAASLRAIRTSDSMVFPLGKTGFWKWEQKLYQLAESIGFVRRPGQGLGTLRKTHATEVYREHGIAAASESLGHRSGTRIARDHYVDAAAHRLYVVNMKGKRA